MHFRDCARSMGFKPFFERLVLWFLVQGLSTDCFGIRTYTKHNCRRARPRTQFFSWCFLCHRTAGEARTKEKFSASFLLHLKDQSHIYSVPSLPHIIERKGLYTFAVDRKSYNSTNSPSITTLYPSEVEGDVLSDGLENPKLSRLLKELLKSSNKISAEQSDEE